MPKSHIKHDVFTGDLLLAMKRIYYAVSAKTERLAQSNFSVFRISVIDGTKLLMYCNFTMSSVKFFVLPLAFSMVDSSKKVYTAYFDQELKNINQFPFIFLLYLYA